MKKVELICSSEISAQVEADPRIGTVRVFYLLGLPKCVCVKRPLTTILANQGVLPLLSKSDLRNVTRIQMSAGTRKDIVGDCTAIS